MREDKPFTLLMASLGQVSTENAAPMRWGGYLLSYPHIPLRSILFPCKNLTIVFMRVHIPGYCDSDQAIPLESHREVIRMECVAALANHRQGNYNAMKIDSCLSAKTLR